MCTRLLLWSRTQQNGTCVRVCVPTNTHEKHTRKTHRKESWALFSSSRIPLHELPLQFDDDARIVYRGVTVLSDTELRQMETQHRAQLPGQDPHVHYLVAPVTPIKVCRDTVAPI